MRQQQEAGTGMSDLNAAAKERVRYAVYYVTGGRTGQHLVIGEASADQDIAAILEDMLCGSGLRRVPDDLYPLLKNKLAGGRSASLQLNTEPAVRIIVEERAARVTWVDVEARVEADPRYPELKTELDTANAAVNSAIENQRQVQLRMQSLRDDAAHALGFGSAR